LNINYSATAIRHCAASDHDGIAAEKMDNKENVALRAVSLRIIKALTRRMKMLRAEDNKMALGIHDVLGALGVHRLLAF
jgi:hypothetical protein